MKRQMIKLGSRATDIGRDLQGTVTHLHIEMDRETRLYSFKVPGVDLNTGEPIRSSFVVGCRLQGGDLVDEPDNIPYGLLGTEVTDTSTGITGMVTAICLHINGCFHAIVQRPGLHPKTGLPYGPIDSDIRLLVGPAVEQLNEEELQRSRRTNPSPIETESPYPAVPGIY